MELINLAWHVGAVVFGVWGLWIGLQAARDKALLQDAVLPLLLDGTDGADFLSKSRFVRAVRYFEMREVPFSLKGRLKFELENIGGVKGMTPGWEVRQLRVLFQIFKAAKSLELAVSGQRQDSPARSDGESREGIVIRGSIVDAQAAALAIAARLQVQSSVCLRLQCRSALQEAAAASTCAISEVYWELTE